MIPGLKSSAIRKKSAVWVCRRFCQPCLGTNCGTTMVIVSLGWRCALISSMYPKNGSYRRRRANRGQPDARPHPTCPTSPAPPQPASGSERDVDGRHIIRQGARIGERRQRAAVDAADRHDHPMADRARRHAVILQRQARRQLAVVFMNRREDVHQNRNQDQHHPGAVSEFGRGEDQHDDPGQTAPNALMTILSATSGHARASNRVRSPPDRATDARFSTSAAPCPPATA